MAVTSLLWHGFVLAKLEVPAYFLVTAELALDGPMLVRAAPSGEQVAAPDVVRFRSGGQSVMPGSNLAGAQRRRASRICQTLAGDEQRAHDLIDGMFGPSSGDGAPPAVPRALRLCADKAPSCTGRPARQTTIALDRLTGAPLPTALIEEQPEWSGEPDAGGRTASVRLGPTRRPEKAAAKDAERGLLLHLLKDLSTGNLSVGGAAVGGGMLRALVEIVSGSAFCTEYAAQRRFAIRAVADAQSEPGNAYRARLSRVRAGQTARVGEGRYALAAAAMAQGRQFWQVRLNVVKQRLGFDARAQQVTRQGILFLPSTAPRS